jgi:hypothetical protein
MKLKITVISIVFILLVFGGLHAQTATPPSMGNGTSGTPYEISTLDNLYWLTQNSTEWDKYFIQTANIDASSTNVWDASAGFTPIGNVTTGFSGSYDGQENSINNLFINRPLEDFIGFIGRNGGSIKNVDITNVNFTGKNTVGGIAGYASGLVDNCSSSGTVLGIVGVGGLVGGIPDTNNGSSTTSNSHSTCDVAGTSTVGGLAGSNGDVVSNCYSTGMVTGGTGGRTGGLIGFTWYGTTSACYSESVVTSTGDNTGGLVGLNGSSNINNCYSTGSVNGASYVGGLVGSHQQYSIVNSYSIGAVSGSGSFVGGLVGDGASGGWGAKNSFWNTETSGQVTSSGGIGATTVEMHSLSTYVDGVDAAWDFMFESLNGSSDIWGMNATVNGGYPYLAWQGYTHTEECCGIIDITDPVLSVQNFALQLDLTGNAVLLLSDVVLSATDNCSIADTTLSQVNFSCSDNPTTDVDVILSDSLGNTTTQTVVITINNSAAGTDTRAECDSLVWIDGNTYYSSNNVATYTIMGGAANSCDSIVTLDLTINNCAAGTDTRTECDSLVWIDGNTYYSSNNVATYTIMGGAANTCDSIVTLDLTINSVNSSVNQVDALLTADESGANYQWLNCPEMTRIVGATNQSYNATVNGAYAVIITNNGCSDTSACFTITSLGIIENTFGNKLRLYPNPTSENFSIDLGDNYQTTVITITDLSGRIIQLERYNDSQLLNLKLNAATGIYLLIIDSENKKAVIRLVKE